MTTSETTVLYTKVGPVAYVSLNRPDVINAYNVRMRDELYLTLEALRDDDEVRVGIISGEGERGFCAGADLTEFGTAPSVAVARDVRWERDIWGLFLSIRKPLIAAIHGYAIGSGVEIACLCDIRIAAENATFSMPEVALGMVPAAGGTQTLPRAVGMSRAMHMVLTNRRLDAAEARRIGLVHEVVPLAELSATAEGYARRLASLSPEALAAAKTTVLAGMDLPLSDGLALERRAVAKLLTSYR
ncbi:MAG: enoyl-CoA hydratase/isomerase family protein [Chloroflexi bacterium]|nr:enoyl-CoA hydratase/isomerase family protein [Chloroflexota bacterium]